MKKQIWKLRRSPRKIISQFSGPTSKYIKRGSFSNVVTGIDTTDSEVEKRLVYLMNDEYFCNFSKIREFETLTCSSLKPNSKVENSTQINKKL